MDFYIEALINFFKITQPWNLANSKKASGKLHTQKTGLIV